MITATDIRVARARLGVKQYEFAERFGVDQATISRWETKGPPSDGPLFELIKRVLAEVNQKV